MIEPIELTVKQGRVGVCGMARVPAVVPDLYSEGSDR